MAEVRLHAAHETVDDAEARALRALGHALGSLPERHRPIDTLQAICDLAREITGAKYAALAVTDEHDYTQGFVTSGLTKEQERALPTPPQGHGPLGSLRADGRPVRYDDVGNAPRAFGFPPKHPNMKTLLGVPIWALGNVRGSLYVADRTDGQPFGDDDEHVLLTLARHVSRVVEEEWY